MPNSPENKGQIISIPSVVFSNQEEAQRFISYLNYSDITGSFYEEDEHKLSYQLYGPEEQSQQILTLFQGFCLGKLETTEETSEPLKNNNSAFIKKRDRYSDVSSTGIMLIIIGFLGFGYIALNFNGTIQIINGTVAYVFNLILFLGALIYGIISLNDSKKLKKEADQEDKLAEEIKLWLSENITASYIHDIPIEQNLPEELAFLERSETIQKEVLKHFQVANRGLIENLTEEHYQALIDDKKRLQ